MYPAIRVLVAAGKWEEPERELLLQAYNLPTLGHAATVVKVDVGEPHTYVTRPPNHTHIHSHKTCNV